MMYSDKGVNSATMARGPYWVILISVRGVVDSISFQVGGLIEQGWTRGGGGQ